MEPVILTGSLFSSAFLSIAYLIVRNPPINLHLLRPTCSQRRHGLHRGRPHGSETMTQMHCSPTYGNLTSDFRCCEGLTHRLILLLFPGYLLGNFVYSPRQCILVPGLCSCFISYLQAISHRNAPRVCLQLIL